MCLEKKVYDRVDADIKLDTPEDYNFFCKYSLKSHWECAYRHFILFSPSRRNIGSFERKNYTRGVQVDFTR